MYISTDKFNSIVYDKFVSKPKLIFLQNFDAVDLGCK